MEVSVTIHEAWLARPEDLRKVMALLAGLEGPRRARPSADGPGPRPPTPTTMRRSRTRKGVPRPGGSRIGATPGSPSPGRGRQPAGRRRQLLGWAVEAGPRPEGDADRLREEEGAAHQDRRMDPAPGRGGLSVRPGETGAAPPIDPRQGSRPVPTPRADAWRARMPERFNDWTIRQRAVYRKIWLEEVMRTSAPGQGSGTEP